MLAVRANRILRRVTKPSRCLSTEIAPKPSEEYTEVPVYPKIEDISLNARRERIRQAWHNEIKQVKTVEEKLIKINMPRYWGFKTILLSDAEFPYNCLPLTKHYTRTCFEQVDGLPESYAKDEANVKSLAESIKSAVENSLEFAAQYYSQKYKDSLETLDPAEKDKFFGQIVVDQINRTLLTSLSADCPHLNEVEVDLEPRHEAFWYVGGVNNVKSTIKAKEGSDWEWLKAEAHVPLDRAIQYLGKPYIALRHRLPLKPITTGDEIATEEQRAKVPIFKYDARVLGYGTQTRHGTNLPGFWPGSPHEFGVLSYHPRSHMVSRNPAYGAEDFQEALHAQGIQASYAWLLGQACYQGFSTYNDLTYPLCTQTIITNGQQWSFYTYQMNTTLIHSKQVHENPKVNYCWGTKEMKLYEAIDDQGKCQGLNEDVLKNLVHFYVNAPAERGIDLKPYLGKKEQLVAHIKDDKKREWLEERFKLLVSNRPRHLPKPEVYLWEKFYKIDHKTRPMDPKRRFFELGINPWRRRLDEHTPKYIPKAIRPGGPKSKEKWEKTYYP